MSIRLPRSLNTQLNVETGQSILEAEILAEHAAALGHHGKAVEKALLALQDATDKKINDKEPLLDSAAQVVYNFFIQREALGVTRHDYAIKFYQIQETVLARVGAIKTS